MIQSPNSLVILLPFFFTSIMASYRVTAYFINWGIYDRNYHPSNIPISEITHLNYAFINVDAHGHLHLGDSYADIEKFYPKDHLDQPYHGNFWQLTHVLKKQKPELKVLASIGGWKWSRHFSDIAANEKLRRNFAKSCLSLIKKYNFDGIDIDWEYPVEGGSPENAYRPDDAQNYVLLLEAIRQEIGPNKELTIAAPANPMITRHLLISQMAPLVSAVNLMTYDFRGSWSKYTGHHTSLYASSSDPDSSHTNIASVVQYYLEKGIPASKIVIGAALYGRGWSGVTAVNNGLFQSFLSIPQGSFEEGVFDYKDILSQLQSGQLTRHWDPEAHAAWFIDEDGTIISMDDLQSIKEKAKYVKEKSLGGIMFWELSGDDDSKYSLVKTAYRELNGNEVSKKQDFLLM